MDEQTKMSASGAKKRCLFASREAGALVLRCKLTTSYHPQFHYNTKIPFDMLSVLPHPKLPYAKLFGSLFDPNLPLPNQG